MLSVPPLPPATIRAIEKGDLSAIARMIAELAAHIRPNFVPLTTPDDLDRYGPTGSGLFEAVIAVRDDRPVGFCLYTYVFSGWRGRPGICINDLYVEPTERSSGLGQALLAAVTERESPKGCSFVKLEVDKENISAQSFYHRLGFVKSSHDDVMVLEVKKAYL